MSQIAPLLLTRSLESFIITMITLTKKNWLSRVKFKYLFVKFFSFFLVLLGVNFPCVIMNNSGPPPSLTIPNRWLDCPRRGSIVAEKFLPFKTPLDSRYNDSIPPAKRFNLDMLFGMAQTVLFISSPFGSHFSKTFN